MEPDTSKVYEELCNGIKTLPEQEGRVLHLYYVESMTWEEIGAALNLSYAAVRLSYWQAIEKLKPKLEGLR
jgi:RNA polymerase sigma factor (sigma-70 family)